MQWRILQQKSPDDYVIATGKATSVRDFVNECCKYLKLKIIWVGRGLMKKHILFMVIKNSLLSK